MQWPHLLIIALLTGTFGIAARLDYKHGDTTNARRSNVLNILLGDSRKMFASHLFSKADAYFHSGYYPSIFDEAKKSAESSHMEQASRHDNDKDEHESGHVHDEHCNHGDGEENTDFLGESRNWIDSFGRHFYPSQHTHMEDLADEREILPWLRLSADLDPQKIETYLVGAYTLRKRLGKPREAEQFLRDGQRANPDSPELLLELGKIQHEEHKDAARARNLWELALRKWSNQQKAGKKPDELIVAQILGMLSTVEQEEGNFQKAIDYLTALKEVSPYKESVDKRIAEVREKMAGAK